jgi:hypothetical protein
VAAVDKQLQDRDEFLREIKARLVQAQVTMKNVRDKTRRDVEYAVNDWVWVCLLQRTAVGITTASHSKLGPKFYGPFKMLQRIGSVSYKLELPPKAGIHDVFHISLLKKFEGAPPTLVVSLSAIHHGCVLPTPEKKLKAWMNMGVWEILVQWTGHFTTDASWEHSLKNSRLASQQYSSRTSYLLGRGVMLSTHLWASNISGTNRRKEIFTKVARIY